MMEDVITNFTDDDDDLDIIRTVKKDLGHEDYIASGLSENWPNCTTR